MKVAIMCGHGMQTNGVWDCGCTYGSYTEAGLMLPITKACVKYLRSSGIEVLTDADKGNNWNIALGVSNANKQKVKLFMSIHCDWYKAGSGVMPLYVSVEGKKIAKAVESAVKSGMKMKSRGCIRRTDLRELNETTMPAVILETGAIKADLKMFQQSYDEYGKCIAKGICAYLGVTFKNDKKPTELYRVRSSWADAKSQKGAFADLQNAILCADVNGMNVYDSKGSSVYSSKKDVQMYRVRLAWDKPATQKGAFQSLSRAKTLCNKYFGYHVYDNDGKVVHTSTAPAQSSADKLIEALKDLEVKCIKNGFVYSNNQSKYTYAEALKTNKHINCARYVSWAMQSAGLLPSGQVIWLNDSIHGNGSDDVKRTCTVTYPRKSAKNCGLKVGDICGFSNPHTMVYAGKDSKGNLLWYSAGSSDVKAKDYGAKTKNYDKVMVLIRPK